MTRAPDFPPRWSNRKAMRVGYLTGRGKQSREIAAILNDGTSPGTIRRMWYLADLQKLGRDRNAVEIRVSLTTFQRKALGVQASKRGMTIEEWARQVIVNAGIPADLFEAIVPEESK